MSSRRIVPNNNINASSISNRRAMSIRLPSISYHVCYVCSFDVVDWPVATQTLFQVLSKLFPFLHGWDVPTTGSGACSSLIRLRSNASLHFQFSTHCHSWYPGLSEMEYSLLRLSLSSLRIDSDSNRAASANRSMKLTDFVDYTRQ